MNQSILVGTVHSLPTLKETNNGNRLCQFTLEVRRPYKNADGESNSDIFAINLWNSLADEGFKSIHVDQMVALRCRLQANNYEKEGAMHYRSELVGEKIYLLSEA